MESVEAVHFIGQLFILHDKADSISEAFFQIFWSNASHSVCCPNVSVPIKYFIGINTSSESDPSDRPAE